MVVAFFAFRATTNNTPGLQTKLGSAEVIRGDEPAEAPKPKAPKILSRSPFPGAKLEGKGPIEVEFTVGQAEGERPPSSVIVYLERGDINTGSNFGESEGRGPDGLYHFRTQVERPKLPGRYVLQVEMQWRRVYRRADGKSESLSTTVLRAPRRIEVAKPKG